MELLPEETERRKVGQGGKKENMRKQWNPEEKYWVYKMLSGKCEEPKLVTKSWFHFLVIIILLKSDPLYLGRIYYPDETKDLRSVPPQTSFDGDQDLYIGPKKPF